MVVTKEELDESEYKDAVLSITTGSEWADSDSDSFIVISKVNEVVKFSPVGGDYTVNKSESDFLHTFTNKDKL